MPSLKSPSKPGRAASPTRNGKMSPSKHGKFVPTFQCFRCKKARHASAVKKSHKLNPRNGAMSYRASGPCEKCETKMSVFVTEDHYKQM